MLFSSCSKKNSDDNSNWYLNSISVNKLWNYSKGDSQTIAFIDTGLSEEYQKYLNNRIVYKYNVVSKNDNVTDNHGHGTEMVSVVAGNSNYGITGIAENAKIMIIKAVDDEGKTTGAHLADAIDCAINHNATIINISLGGYKSFDNVIAKIKTAVSKNITVVAAAGDYGNKDLLFPANIDNVISVEGKTKENKIWENSNTSDSCVFAFPATEINVLSISTDNSMKKNTVSGTSESSALASGYIAIIKDYASSKSIPLTNQQIIEFLKGTNSLSEKSDYLYPLNQLEK
jgi:hypothetical protein